jgi:ketosteroid isomerase-like protein
MLVCKNCNIEYEEGKKFCKHCGDPLVPKDEPLSAPKKVNRSEDENSDGKLICPVCKIVYEFGSSCIQCGSPLGRQMPPGGKEESESAHRTGPAEKESPLLTSKEIPSQEKEEPNIPRESVAEEKPLQVQTIQEQLIEAPRKKLICPDCGIIYERGTSCVRCGSSLVPQTASQEKQKPKSSDAETPPSTSPPKASGEISKMDLDQDLVGATMQPPVLSPKEKDLGVSQPVKRKEIGPSLEELFQDKPLEQQPPKKATDQVEKRVSSAKKPKRDYRRLFLEVGGITVMVLAGGYFLWSVYLHLIAKSPEPRSLTSQEAVSQTFSSSSSTADPATTTPESRGFKNTEESSTVSKEAIPPSLFHSDTSNTSSTEVVEVRDIKALLEDIRQANLEKNIDLFISCYATDFKDREGKKKTTLAYWKRFDYVDLSYDLKDASISGDTAKAKVEWLIKTSSKAGARPQENKSILDVQFKKEEGEWKIKEVKTVR